MGFLPINKPEDPGPVRATIPIRASEVPDVAILEDEGAKALRDHCEGKAVVSQFRLQRYILQRYPMARGQRWVINWANCVYPEIIVYEAQLQNPFDDAVLTFIHLDDRHAEYLMDYITALDGGRYTAYRLWRWVYETWAQTREGGWSILHYQGELYIIKTDEGDDDDGPEASEELPPDPGLARERPVFSPVSDTLPGVVTADMIIGATS